MHASSISQKTWGPKPHLMKWTWECVVRPALTYGSVIWAHESQRPLVRTKLRSLNRLALSTLTSFPSSSPIQVSEILTDTFPLHLYLLKEGLCAFIRLHSQLQLDWSGLGHSQNFSISHRKFWLDLLQTYELSHLTQEVDHTWGGMPPKLYQVDLDSFNSGRPDWFGDLTIYTDGSKWNGQVGAGVYVRQHDGVLPVFSESTRLSDSSSVFQAEMTAILRALVYLQSQGDFNTAIIYSDSQAALQALNAESLHSKLVEQVVLLLNSLSGQIVLRWVRAHAGHSGNEQADSFAKMGCYRDLPTTPTPFPRKLIRTTVVDKLRTIWDQEWSTYPHARQSRYFCSGQDHSRGKEICQLSRFSLGRLIRVVTGHNGFNAHRHNVDNDISAACRLCGAGQDSFLHFITVCPSLSQDRVRILTKSFLTPHVWDVDEILAFSRLPRISYFMDKHGFYSASTDDDQDSSSDSSDEDTPELCAKLLSFILLDKKKPIKHNILLFLSF